MRVGEVHRSIPRIRVISGVPVKIDYELELPLGRFGGAIPGIPIGRFEGQSRGTPRKLRWRYAVSFQGRTGREKSFLENLSTIGYK